MKLLIEKIGKAGERVGKLELGTSTLNTPFPLLTTKGGCLPHLTNETLGYLQWAKEAPITIPMQYHIHQTDILEKFGNGLASFLAMPNHSTILTMHDTMEELRSGYNNNKSVSVWQFGSNNVHVEPEQYMKMVLQAKPTAFLALCDGDTKPDCSNKRISKSVSKSLDFLDSCLEIFSESSTLEKTAIIGAVEGGLSLNARIKSARELALRPVDGFLMDGFHHNGPNSETIVFETFKDILEKIDEILPRDKPKFYFGAAPPHLVFDLAAAGIDVFDCTYPNLATERDAVLIFPNKIARQEIQDEVVKNTLIEYEMKMTDERFKMDFSPLVSSCSCYACQNFTRSYVHHLVMTKEMLNRVLITIHNLHHYHTFFVSLQNAIKEDTVEKLKHIVLGRQSDSAG